MFIVARENPWPWSLSDIPVTALPQIGFQSECAKKKHTHIGKKKTRQKIWIGPMAHTLNSSSTLLHSSNVPS